MKKCLLAILLLAAYDSYAQFGKPVFTYTVSNPRADVIGSDIPLFALYEKGDVLYSKNIGGQIKIYHEKERMESVSGFLRNEKENRHYFTLYTELTGLTNQPSNIFYFNTDSAYSITIYGDVKNDSLLEAGMQQSATVDLLDGTIRKIINYNSKNAKEWLPDSIEVLLWDYSHSSSKGIAWPAEWPGLSHKTTVERGYDLYSIYIDKKDFDKLKKYITEVENDGGNTVLLNKKKWSISYRFPFPGIK